MSAENTPKPKRFYEQVSIEKDGSAFQLLLDGRKVKTKSQNRLVVPYASLGESVKEEWEGQGEHIDSASMPMTNLVSTALDADDETVNFWREEVIKFLGTDLVCYRANSPQELVDAQAKAWDQYLDWFAEEFSARLKVTDSVTAIAQPEDGVDMVRESIKMAFPLTCLTLFKTVGVLGSAVLALALWRRAYDAETLFEASRVDERFQEQRWGVDSEAKQRENNLYTELLGLDNLFAHLASGEEL